MFVYQSRFLRRGEVWFDNHANGERVDWILYRNRSQPVPGARWRYFHNRLIDLSKSSEELASELQPRTAAKIRTAEEKERVRCEWLMLADEPQLKDVEQIWNGSIEAKRRWGMFNRLWFRPMIAAGVFELMAAREADGALLAYAALFRDVQRAQQLMIVSPPRATLNPAGRAKTNRACSLLIWRTVLRLREQGLRWFDFGGWYQGTQDIQLLGANEFKKGFGGDLVREYECEQAITLKGWVLLTAARLIARATELRSNGESIWENQPNEAIAS